MAFNVAPTSGVGPFELTSFIDNSVNINGVDFRAVLMRGIASGSCPAVGDVAFTEIEVNQLINTGSLVFADTVPSGACRIFELLLYRISDNTVIDNSKVFVDNV